jgi:hypothetical protein
MKIYVLFENSGIYEDFSSIIIKTFKSKEHAEEEKQKLEDKNEYDRNRLNECEDFMFEERWYKIEEHELMTKPKYTR